MHKLIQVRDETITVLDEMRESMKKGITPASYDAVIRKVLKKSGLWKKPKEP